MAVSKRLRHEIFRRDNHTCQSCGAKAPDVKLEPDHVIPIALGGSDDPSNLQTLCAECNGGKSATPPDAATVAKVADDAMRWSQAIQAAAGDMLGKRKGRDEARAAFDAKWKSWSEGRPPLPRPNGWEVSVDSFIKAGLPIPALLDCVDIAMSRRHVSADGVFKYMCGIAWKEVRQLQKDAHALLVPGTSPAEAPDEVVDLWEEVVADLLETLTPDERRTHEIDEAEMPSLEVNEDDRYPIVVAFESVLTDLRIDLWCLADSTDRLLRAIPDGVGQEAMRRARVAMYDRLSDHTLISRHRFAEWAIREAVELLEEREAANRYSGLTADQQAAWREYAETVQGTRSKEKGYLPWSEFSEEDRLRHAAHHAREAKELRSHGAMCQAPGEVIDNCPRVAGYVALVAEARCCSEQTLTGHGHSFCEPHLTELVDGTFRAPSGELFSIRDFKEIDPQAEEEPPF